MEKACRWSDFLSFHILFLFLLEVIFLLQCIDFLVLSNTVNTLLLLFIIKTCLQVHVLVFQLYFEIRNLYGVDKLNALIFSHFIYVTV
jgi:ABC-type protease/lipase transport system fused ATPase/permease subunit